MMQRQTFIGVDLGRDSAHSGPFCTDYNVFTRPGLTGPSLPREEVRMPLCKLREFLDSHNIKYLVISHSLAYTAQGVAALAHVSGKKLAKTVIVKIDEVLAMVVIPASEHVDLDQLRELTGAKTVAIASEGEFKDAFPDCETGAMPPFGNLYDMAVYADPSLAEQEEITFSAGSHRELVRMRWVDMARLVNPTVAPVAYQHAAAA
jgi:Ala-tRNA(Pro) deacylase